MGKAITEEQEGSTYSAEGRGLVGRGPLGSRWVSARRPGERSSQEVCSYVH